MARSTTANAQHFLLVDLTPAARNLYRTYRQACRRVVRLGEAMETARQRQNVPASAAWHMEQEPDLYDQATRDRVAAHLARETQAYNAAVAVWERAAQEATDAFQAAVSVLEAQGYQQSWFNNSTGAMRIPAHLDSPGMHRRRRSR